MPRSDGCPNAVVSLRGGTIASVIWVQSCASVSPSTPLSMAQSRLK
jgi:hypothetical protein